MQRNKRKSNAALLSVISNAGLVVLKLVVGAMIGSVSVISEAIHSGWTCWRPSLHFCGENQQTGGRGPSFGHGKVENISGTIEALLIFLAAGWIIFEAVKAPKS